MTTLSPIVVVGATGRPGLEGETEPRSSGRLFVDDSEGVGQQLLDLVLFPGRSSMWM
jgi:hypothetical protein